MKPSPRLCLVPAAVAAAAAALTAVSAAPAPAADEPERRVQVAMVNFTDSRIPDAGTLETALKDNYFGGSGSLTSYYNEVTGGATTFKAAEGDGVTGPVDIDLAATGCDTGKINDLTRKALAAEGVPEDSYDHLSLVFLGEGGLRLARARHRRRRHHLDARRRRRQDVDDGPGPRVRPQLRLQPPHAAALP